MPLRININDEINALFLNSGENYFTNKSVSAGVALAGWGWGTEFVDFENDGDEDLFVVTGFYFPDFSNRLFRNISGEDSLIFEDITIQSGLADYDAAHGMAVFDYDDDGDQDLLISNVDDGPFLYSNQMEQGNWLNVQLEGTETNRSAFGTVVEIEADGQAYRKYHHGAQFQAQNILPVHFGLGVSKVIDKITIYWLNGHVDEFDSVGINQTVRIIEGGDLISKIKELDTNQILYPESICLIGNYPNPFNNSTRIRFSINLPGEVELRIFNTLGQSVQIINKSFSSPGEKTINWDTGEGSVTTIGSGVYFYRLRIKNQFSNVGKIILLK